MQKPDHARARPTTVEEGYYDKIFSDKYPIDLYVKSAQVIKKIDDFLDFSELPRNSKNNLIFYIAMYATCITLRMSKPKPDHIASLRVEDITDDIMDECLEEVKELYSCHGGDDRAAKGPKIIEGLKKKLDDRFINPLRLERPMPQGKGNRRTR